MRKFLTKHLKIAALLCTVMLFSEYANAQISVSGKIVSEEDTPLPGVSVLVKGTNQGTTTDADGLFKLQVPDASSVLVLSFVGYLTEEITVGSQTDIQFRMMPDIASLQEVVVIGYGTQKKGDVTGAVTRVKSEDFLVGKVQDATDLIKGKVAGLIITKSSGDPNETSNIMLRGVTTFNSNVRPLIILNGIPIEYSALASIAPENIETIDVLKDASAAAIYGTRGANGVILITTKTGMRDMPVSVNYTGYASVSDFYKQADFMSATDVRKGLNSFSDEGWDTDWVDAVTRTGYMQNHSLTVDGGGKNSMYSVNFSYRNEAGTIENTDNDQYRIQMNLDQYLLNDIVKLNFNVLKQYHKNSINDASDTDPTNIYRQAVIRNPTSPIYDETTGAYAENSNVFQYFNPVALLNEMKGEKENETTNLIGNITVEPIDRWKTNLLLSTSLFTENIGSYATSKYAPTVNAGTTGWGAQIYNSRKQKTLELTSSYDLAIDQHRFTALAGYSYYYWLNNGFSAGNGDFPSDSYLYNNLGIGSMLADGKASMDSYKNDATLVSFFGRLQYAFGDRFNVLASIRKEGSSKFGENYQWGVFPAVSAGWTISNENFMSSVSWLDNLRLRVGYGETGRSPNDSYQSLTVYDYGEYFMNPEGDWVRGLKVAQNPNPNLKWEETAEVNLGLDFALFKSKVKGSIDVYNRKTTDLLYSFAVPVPPNLYDQTLANAAAMRNRGIEIMLSGTPVTSGDFQWNTTVTVTHNENEVLQISNGEYETEDYVYGWAIGDPISVPSHRIEVGRSVGNFWGLKSVGLTEDGLFLVEDPNTGEALPYSTSLNNDTYRQVLGNGVPKIYLGWNNSLRYKNFDLNLQISGQFGFQILNQQRLFYQNNSIQYNRLKSASDVVYGVAPLSNSQAQAYVSYYIEDGDFIKFDNATLGYNFNTTSLSRFLSKARVYVSAQNFLILTGYSGLDPELANKDIYTIGSDPRDKYPTIRSFTLGVNVTLK